MCIGAGTFNLLGSLLGGILMFLLLYFVGRWATETDPQILRILLTSPKLKSQNLAPFLFAGSPMFRFQRIFKNYAETGSFNELVNLYGFVDSHVFLTKTGDLGVVLEVRGVDYECLDGNTLDGLTKRRESALKLFDENYRIYQYLFKRNNERIPYKLYDRPVVDTAIKNCLTYLAAKADSLFSLSIYYIILFEDFRTGARSEAPSGRSRKDSAARPSY
jgi:hypothetical protein